MPDTLIGYWSADSDSDPSQKEFMQITENRMIHYLIPEIGKKHMPMSVWFTHEKDFIYRIQYRPDGNSWTREIFRDGPDLIIRAENKDFRFTSITKDQGPIGLLRRYLFLIQRWTR